MTTTATLISNLQAENEELRKQLDIATKALAIYINRGLCREWYEAVADADELLKLKGER